MADSNHTNLSSHADVEKQGHDATHANGQGSGGAALGRQVSIQLSAEQYERLFFQPGGPTRGDAAKRLGNPTLLGVVAFLICLTPTAMYLMAWRTSAPTSTPVLTGAYYFVGALCMILAAIGEFLLGNTFPMVVFATFGAFWGAFGVLNDPMHNVLSAFEGGAEAPTYNAGLALYFVCWAILSFIYFVGGLRTNILFEVIFFTLIFAFSFLAAGYFTLARATAETVLTSTVYALRMFKAAGAFGFVTTLAGWYLALVLSAASTGVPLPLPVGDLSGFLNRKPKE